MILPKRTVDMDVRRRHHHVHPVATIALCPSPCHAFSAGAYVRDFAGSDLTLRVAVIYAAVDARQEPRRGGRCALTGPEMGKL